MTIAKKNKTDKGEIKIFKDLKNDIILAGHCCSCGSCVAYCESQSFDVIKMSKYTPMFKSDANEENCKECGLCYYICPQTETLTEKLIQEDNLGSYQDVIAAKTTEKSLAEVGQDGGVVSTILYYLFDTNKIDAAVVSEYDKNLLPEPKLIFNKEELLKSAGTRYTISSQVLPLKDIYNIPDEILKEKHIIDNEEIRIAFVGTPCQIRAIAKMKILNVKPAHTIKYIISLFCYENFDYDKLYELIAQEINVKSKDIKKTWIKKNFFVMDKKDKVYEINIKKLDSAVRNHCHECDEFTGKFSDISVGASGAPKGYSMIISRTEKGVKLIESLLANNLIEDYENPIDQEDEWKQKKIKNFKRMITLKTK